MADLSIITSARMLLHNPGAGHPERPDRLRALLSALRSCEGASLRWIEAQPATREQIERVHALRHIERLEALRGRHFALDPDTSGSPDSVECAFLAAGATVQAADEALSGRSPALALVRPPGHHAESTRAMGFCLLNNIAVAAAHAIEVHGLERVLIVDWDVHHGNGTQDIFWRRRDVLYFSVHQHPFYPGTGAEHDEGAGDGAGFTINVPLPAGSTDQDFIDAFEHILVPAADAFRPDLVLVSAGFDAHRLDPLADMQMTEKGFAALARIVHQIAQRHSGGRLALILEGGYSIEGLTGSVSAVIEALAGNGGQITRR